MTSYRKVDEEAAQRSGHHGKVVAQPLKYCNEDKNLAKIHSDRIPPQKNYTQQGRILLA
jgi:hypothetical protein